MFAKYFFQNIKHHPLRYITIVVCEIVMIILSMIANGIFLDSLAEYNGAKLWSRATPHKVHKLEIKHD